MKYNPLDGDRAANHYNSLPKKEKEGIMSMDEAFKKVANYKRKRKGAQINTFGEGKDKITY